jgi:2,3-bisphosphoglycerate-independent phosphoglycerate mutase
LIVGRYYAMDRDRRQERINSLMIFNGIGTHTTNAVASIEESYSKCNRRTIHPTVMVDENNIPLSTNWRRWCSYFL